LDQSRTLNVALTRSGIPDLLARLGQWWLDELLALFPGRFAEWLTGRGYKRLTLRVEPDFVVLQLLEWCRGDFDPQQFDIDEINRHLASLAPRKCTRRKNAKPPAG
jgi:hypothetical protein